MPTSLQPRGAYQAPLSMGFPREEYWGWLPFPSPGDLSDPGIEPISPALTGGLVTTEPPAKPLSLTFPHKPWRHFSTL